MGRVLSKRGGSSDFSLHGKARAMVGDSEMMGTKMIGGGGGEGRSRNK